MDPIVFAETDGEVYDTGALRFRLLAQSPDQPIAITDSAVPPGFPGPAPARRHDGHLLCPGGRARLRPGRRVAHPWSGLLRAGATGGQPYLRQPGVSAGPVSQYLPAGRPRAVPEGGRQTDGGGTLVVAGRDGGDRLPV